MADFVQRVWSFVYKNVKGRCPSLNLRTVALVAAWNPRLLISALVWSISSIWYLKSFIVLLFCRFEFGRIGWVVSLELTYLIHIVLIIIEIENNNKPCFCKISNINVNNNIWNLILYDSISQTNRMTKDGLNCCLFITLPQYYHFAKYTCLK